MSNIKNVTIVGGSGNLGTFILKQLVASQKFNVQVLKRAGSSSAYASSVEVIETDFSSIESIKRGFKNQDAVVSVVGDAGVSNQTLMVDAAIASGVKRFLPSNFGSNLANPTTRQLPIFSRKVAVEDYLIDKSKTSAITHTFVYTGGLLDFCLQHNVLLDTSKCQPELYDGGDYTFSSTRMATVGDAVVGVLTHPTETQNRAVYVSEVTVSQNEVLSIAKRIAPNKPWDPVNVKLDELVALSNTRLRQGHHDLPTVVPILLQSLLSPQFGGRFDENDNQLLGVKEKSEEVLIELLRPLLQ